MSLHKGFKPFMHGFGIHADDAADRSIKTSGLREVVFQFVQVETGFTEACIASL